ncbi:MAG: quinone-dependent dihydroorotate dehydrogenase [Limisphaerales bacterium]
MSWAYRKVLRPVLFRQDPERVHDRTMRALGIAGRSVAASKLLGIFFGAPSLPLSVFGLRFHNPIGLGAGMDKHGKALPAWQALGFGFTELGAVTWHPQLGNPPPRIFRAVADSAIVNRMGFNNPGAEEVADTLTRWRKRNRWPNHPVGMNLGKSKITPLDKAPEDYARSFRVLLPLLDFFVVNVSSPNTPNLRQLQDKRALDEILAALEGVQRSAGATAKPVLVKVAPDLSFEAIDEILELTGPRQIAGIVATNTTLDRPETADPKLQRIYAEAGGLSGVPLRKRSTEVVRHLYRQTGGKLPIIGVGGVFSAADAWEKITAGASLVQIYTGLVYEGPGLVRRVLKGLRDRLSQQGLTEVQQAVGIEAR